MFKRINSRENFLVFILRFFVRRSKKILYSDYNIFTDHLKNIHEEEPLPEKCITIKTNTIHTVLQKLNKFEESKKFLKKEISLTSLASSLDTNPRYLSEIIKVYKGKSYNSYINSLRINHIIEKLNQEPIYRRYKINYLAEYSGFASREVFTAAFKKEIGVTPSYFISKYPTTEI